MVKKVTGYQKRYTGFDGMKGDKKEHYLDDASGYVSGRYLAVKLDPSVKCDRCDRWACHIMGGKDEHRLCLRCRDNWCDFTEQPKIKKHFSLRTWHKYYSQFLETEPWNEQRYKD